MKTLHLLRHAKSSWSAPDLDDHDRDLNDRGRRDAPRMGAALAELIPAQRVHCSSARRARLTLDGLCASWPAMADQPHVVDEALYTFDYHVVLDWLRGHQSDTDACFLIGHNPAFTELCNALTGRQTLDNLPTAGYLQLSLPVDHWSDIGAEAASLEHWLFPRDLPR